MKRKLKRLRYKIKAWWIMLVMKLRNQTWCEACEGDGFVAFSCCGDDIKGSDDWLCPSYYEHCDGCEEDCEDCRGTGKVKIKQ